MSSIFQAGGALPADHFTYVERQADYDALRAAVDGEYLHVIAPRQLGKTSLLKRLAHRLAEMGWRCVYVDLATLMDFPKPDWYAELGKVLARTLTPGEVPALANQVDLRCYLLDQALPRSDGQPCIALLLDEVEGAGKARDADGKPFSDTFFSMFRALYNERDRISGTLVVALAGAVNPGDLVSDPDVSPFNVGREIGLDDFTSAEAQALTDRLVDLGLPVDDSVHQAIYNWTNGHPYLFQRICAELETIASSGDLTAITPGRVDRIVKHIILNPANPLQQDKNLRHVAKMLSRLSPLAVEIWSRLQAGESISRKEAYDLYLELYLTGAVKAQSGQLVLRNRIYQKAFWKVGDTEPLLGRTERGGTMGRKEDLGGHIRESNELVRQYEDIIRLSDNPKERARAQRVINEQWEFIGGYLSEYLPLCQRTDTPLPADISEIAARFETVTEKRILSGLGQPPSTPPPSGPVYVTHIDHAEGIAIGDGAHVERREAAPAATQAAPPGVSVSLLTCIVPTAFCHQLDAKAFPLVAVTLDNTGQGCANAALRVSAAIEDYSDIAIATPRVSQGEQVRVSLLPVLKPAAVATLNETRPATLRVTVELIVSAGRTLYDQTERIQLHARDTALLAVEAPDGSIVDLTEYLVAWVTPRRPEIEKLLRQAAEHHPNRQFVGYQGASTLVQGAKIVREQVRTIFAALKQDANVVYINSPLNLGKQAGQVTQRVRLPTESLAAGSSANCIDGTVLFASLLELASIDPFIVIVPGHAFAGWRVWEGVSQYEFLETTMIGSDDFDAAQQAAQAQYDDVLMKGYFSRGLFDPGGFARLIDVASCRANGILPLE